MRFLLTNDDGILGEGIWALAKHLAPNDEVIIAAPDHEQSAIGTAVTLRQSLRVQTVKPQIPGVETYAVSGTPSDAAILALGNLVKGPIDLVISGINQGLNVGEDVYISGTVGAALQAYLRGFTAMSVSTNREILHLDSTAKIAAMIAREIVKEPLLKGRFLNVNIPDLPATEIKGARVARLAAESHINSVEEDTHGWNKYYWLVREQVNPAVSDGTDIGAVDQGYIAITNIRLDPATKSPGKTLENLCLRVTKGLRQVTK